MTIERVKNNPQKYLARIKTLEDLKNVSEEIDKIEKGEKLKEYNEKVCHILEEYRLCSKMVKTIIFDMEDKVDEDKHLSRRLLLIEQFLSIAKNYITLEITKKEATPQNLCKDCNNALDDVPLTEDGMLRCPECMTEYGAVVLTKLPKDGARINMGINKDDESIENFMRAFMRYQGLQTNRPSPIIYTELDKYFTNIGRPPGEEIRKLPLNSRGRRGDTSHLMLWEALGKIGHSEHYEDANLIGHIYWGWVLPDVMKYKETISRHYIETQRVFHEIPDNEKDRESSLGTQYRLWRHLQLVGHECYPDEFKMATNDLSISIHNRLWKKMCDGCTSGEVYYIP